MFLDLYLCVCLFVFVALMCFHIERGRVLEIVDAIYWALDLVVCCRTGGSESMAINEIVFSQLVRLPVDHDYSRVGLPGDYCPPGHEIRKVFEAIALDEVQVMFYQILQRIDNPNVLLALRLVVYLLCLCAFIHVSGSVWFAVGEADETGWVYQYGGIFATWVLRYVESCHCAVTQMQGSAEIMPGNFRERAVSALHY